MKKITLLFSLIFATSMLFSQAVIDYAIVPVSINLNSIFRLNVTSGGSIEFTLTTLAEYNSGIDGNTKTRYQTHFNVASSIDFDVTIQSEDATFIGANGNTMDFNNLGYSIAESGTGTEGAGNDWLLTPSAVDVTGGTDWPSILTNAAVDIVTSQDVAVDGGTGGAGDGSKNSFQIIWELGTKNLDDPLAPGPTDMSPNSILENSIAPDRYSTNVFLTLEAH